MRRGGRAAASQVRVGTALKVVGVCLLIATTSVGYVQQSHEISGLKIQAARLEAQWQQLRNHNSEQRRILLQWHTHESIEKAVAQRVPGLGPARSGQVVVLTLPQSGAIPVREPRPTHLTARGGVR